MRACGALVCGGRGEGPPHRDSFTATPSQRRVRESLARLCEGVPLKGVARSHRLHPRRYIHQRLLARRLHVGDMLDALARSCGEARCDDVPSGLSCGRSVLLSMHE